jgi:DNA ligase (NAD+)
MEVKDLEAIIKKANQDYFTKGSYDLEDDEYDNLLKQLEELDPNNPLLHQVGDNTSTENKAKLPVIMGSQKKFRIGECDLKKIFPENTILTKMSKLDGLSMLIEYDENGDYQHLYTRGNGLEGQDITYRGSLMKFPKKLPESLMVKGSHTYLSGEAVVSDENYKKVKGSYKHKRNFIGGTLRPILTDEKYKEVSDDVKFNCSLIDIVIWEMPSAEELGLTSLFETLEKLEQVGFKTTFHEKINSNDLDDEKVENFIKYLKSDDYPYLCDGAVFKIDNTEIFNKLGKEADGLNPKGSRAIKLPLEKQFVEKGEIAQVIWEMSKRGLMKPVIILKEGLNFDGATITRINGVNAKYVEEGNWQPGTIIQIIRSGDVIPRIIYSYPNPNPVQIPTTCPFCGEPLQSTGTDLYCANENCAGRNQKEVVAFFSDLKLEDVGATTIEDLFEKGFNTYEKLLGITYDQIINLPGYQAKKALNISKKLNNCLKDISLGKLMAVSQCFQNEKNSLSEKRFEMILDCLGEENVRNNLDGVLVDGEKVKLASSKLIEVNGLGEGIIDLFKSKYAKFKTLYNRIKPYVKIVSKRVYTGKMEGMSFCFTQFRDKSLEELIINNGGKVGGLTKKTTCLFFAGDSGKMKKAKEYGIETVPAIKAREYLEEILK